MPELGAVQGFVVSRALELPKTAKEFRRDIQRQLVAAHNRRRLTTGPHLIAKYLCLEHPDSPRAQILRELPDATGAFCIFGGQKNQDRDLALQRFKRDDGAWFDFALTGLQRKTGVELVAYNFEIRLPAAHGGSPFFRFDLNTPGHANDAREMRCHMHAGSDEVLLPAVMMTPAELLTLFIDGLRAPSTGSARRPTAFELDWWRATHRLRFGHT